MKEVCSPVAVLMILTASCLSAPKKSGAEEMDQTIQVLESSNPAEYEQVMQSFAASARKGDVNQMIALTSKTTIAQIGRNALKEHYLKDTIPVLKSFPKMHSGGQVDYVEDSGGGSGWIFRKIFVSPTGKEAKLKFVILKEKGMVRVSSFGQWN